MSGAELVVQDLVAGYDAAPPVLSGVSLEVTAGEVLAVLGRNGAGKTTLLRCIAGLLKPRSGRVIVNGVDVAGWPAHKVAKHSVALVPEGRRVIPGMTVIDNLKLGAYLLPRSNEINRALDDVFAVFPALVAWSHRRAGTLSGGQQQLLSIGRALMTSPSVLLLDEPLTGLDPLFQTEVITALQNIKSGDRSILLVEQNARRSLSVADRGLVLAEGAIVLTGSASALRDDPRVQEGYLGTSRIPSPRPDAA
ncbi:MAG: ABC transporter ATP-binding protein [Candidatus Dormibacteria bacterium]